MSRKNKLTAYFMSFASLFISTSMNLYQLEIR